MIGRNNLSLTEMGSTFMLNEGLLSQFLLYFNMCLSMFAASCLMFCSMQDEDSIIATSANLIYLCKTAVL